MTDSIPGDCDDLTIIADRTRNARLRHHPLVGANGVDPIRQVDRIVPKDVEAGGGLSYGGDVQNRSDRIDRVEISDTAEHCSVLLSADDRPVVLVRMMADAPVEEVVNGAGVVAHGAVSSWTLVERTLTFEYNPVAAAASGFARLHQLPLDVSAEEIGQLSDALLEILDTACCVVETPAGRIVR